MVIAVYDKCTKEILALIVKDGECVVRNDVDFAIYENNDPVLTEIDGKVYYYERKFMVYT